MDPDSGSMAEPDPDPSFMRMQSQGLKNSKLKEIYKKHDQNSVQTFIRNVQVRGEAWTN